MDQARKFESHLREQSRETELVSNDSGAVEDWSKTAKSVIHQLAHLLRDARSASYSTVRYELEVVRQSFQANAEHENQTLASDPASGGAEREGTDEAQGGHKANASEDDRHDKGDDDNDDESCSSVSSQDSGSTSSGGSTSSSSSGSDSSLSSCESNDAS